jgi:hypothetical protein
MFKCATIKGRQASKAFEIREKKAVRKRDGVQHCRIVPGCVHERTVRCEAAHIDGKGMGGDHGRRSHRSNMIRACYQHHQGPISLHSKLLEVRCLTDAGADGPIQTWHRASIADEWTPLMRESAVNVIERIW